MAAAVDITPYARKIKERLELLFSDGKRYMCAASERVYDWIDGAAKRNSNPDLVAIDRLFQKIEGMFSPDYGKYLAFGKYNEYFEVGITDVITGRKRVRLSDEKRVEKGRAYREDQIANCDLGGHNLSSYAFKVDVRVVAPNEEAAKKLRRGSESGRSRVKFGHFPGIGYVASVGMVVGKECLDKLVTFAEAFGNKKFSDAYCDEKKREQIAAEKERALEDAEKRGTEFETKVIPRTYMARIKAMLAEGKLDGNPEVLDAAVRYLTPSLGFEPKHARILYKFAFKTIPVKTSQVLGSRKDDIRYLDESGQKILGVPYTTLDGKTMTIGDALSLPEMTRAEGMRLMRAAGRILGKPLRRLREEHNLANLRLYGWTPPAYEKALEEYATRFTEAQDAAAWERRTGIGQPGKVAPLSKKAYKKADRLLETIYRGGEPGKRGGISPWLSTLRLVPMRDSEKLISSITLELRKAAFEKRKGEELG